MVITQQHIRNRTHEHYKECDRVTHLCKNLYNQALYRIRQNYFSERKYTGFFEMANTLTKEKQIDYRSLPTKVSKMVLRKLDNNFSSFFEANKAYKLDPKKFNGKPKLPKYLDKKSNFLAEYYIEAISKTEFKKGFLKLSQTSISIPIKNIKYEDFIGARIVVRKGYFVIEIMHEVETKPLKTDNGRYCGIDLGLNNLATLAFSTGDKPLIINGRALKSINQQYNKETSKLRSYLSKMNNKVLLNNLNEINSKGIKITEDNKKEIKNILYQPTTKRIQAVNLNRMNKIKDYMHKASTFIVNHLVSNNINTLIIGKNKQWKQDIKLGKKNNQNFVQIPFNKLIDMLKYKCVLNGLNVILTEESYTSRCSFIDDEPLCKRKIYAGKRDSRSFTTSSGLKINADVNGAYNIIRKVVHDFKWIEGLSVTPSKKLNF